tara:strand:+ start:991 stop:2364 length:1374 start_codon:yes stop_codon:yes gene_type:complete
MKISKLTSKQAHAQKLIYDIFTNNGIVGMETEDRDRLSLQFDFHDVFKIDSVMNNEGLNEFKDAFFTEDLTRFIGTTVTNIVQEAVEPELLVVPNLFKSVAYEGPGRTVEIGGVGALHAAEVPEGQEYPEADFTFGDGYIIQLGIAKHGLKLRITQEVIDDNLFDVFGMWLQMAGRALARHKEEYGIMLLNDMGITVFDNSQASTATALGTTSGRNIAGDFNGSMTANDIFDMWVYGYLRGFNYDTLLMNPLAWKVFMNDDKAREIFFSNGIVASNRAPEGSGANTFGSVMGGMGYKMDPYGNDYNNLGAGEIAGPNPFTQSLNPLGSSFQLAPRYLPSPLKVIVSPHVGYSQASIDPAGDDGDAYNVNVTDIIMADSQNCGLLMTKEGVSMDEWNDPERDIRAMKIKERWGMALLAQGKGVAVAKNVVIEDNYTFENTNSATLAAQGTAAITSGTV